ncbi:MAG: ComEC/Rec2 family competence protein [Phycisphaerae bacterium]
MNPREIQPGLSALPVIPRHRRLAPLLPVAIGMIAGIVIDDRIHLGVWTPVALLTVGAAVVIARGGRGRIAVAALVLAAMALGSVRHALSDRRLPDNHIVFFTRSEPVLAHLRGRVASRPRVTESKTEWKLPYAVGPKTRFVLDATLLDGRVAPIDVCGRVAVVIRGAADSVRIGDCVEMTGWLYRPPGPQNPGAYDWARHRHRNGLHAGFSCAHAESVRVLTRANARTWAGTLDRLRTHLRACLLHDTFAGDDPGAGVIAAMVLGQRSAVSEAMNRAFVSTGNAHFLAASGMHVAWLSLLAWWTLTRIAGVPYRTTVVFVALLIVSFVAIAEPRPSILRAGIIGLLACASIFRRGRHHSMNWLACAALLILLIDPADLFRPAFQFSFLAVVGLLYLRPRVAKRLATVCAAWNLDRIALSFDRSCYAATLTEAAESRWGALGGLCDFVAFALAQLFAIALSEWLITAPLSCYVFNNLMPWGWLGSFVLWFFALPATATGYVTVLAGLVFPPSGVVLRPILAATTGLMIDCVDWLARLPGTMLDGRSPSTAWLIAVYGVVWLWVFRPEWMRVRRGFPIAVMLLIAWWLVPPRWIRHDRDAVDVWALAIGNGTATVVELPDGKVLLCDFGTRSSFDAGPVGVTFLKHRGIRRIDAVFISHANFDHFSAVPTLAREFDIGRVVVNDHFQPFAGKGTSGANFLAAMRDADVPVEVTHGPFVLDDTGDVRVEAIWPPPVAEQRVLDSNDASTVLRLTWQGRSVLLTGDIAEFAMGRLLERGDLQADALALPHHGSVVATTGAFIRAVDPRIVVRSSGQSQAQTFNGIERRVGDRTYFNTADDGCILIQIRNAKITATAVMQTP